MPPAPRRPLPPAIWVLGLVSLLMDVSSEMIHSLLPVFMIAGLGASATMLGVLEGLAEALALIVRAFAGTLSDLVGRRKPLAVLGYGLGALAKPLFALAASPGWVFAARLIDRFGKGIRGAPRDALVADLTPRDQRGAAYGLRQALDTVGALLGPLLAIALMLLWANDFRAVFAVAIVPALLSVAVLLFGVHEPPSQRPRDAEPPWHRASLAQLPTAYWWVVGVGAALTLARFSEGFLVLRLQQGGLPLALAPLVMVAMSAVYAVAAFPLGRLADSVSHTRLLAWGLVLLIGADALLAWRDHGPLAWLGIALWGLHMAMTQGLLATMVADHAPAALRGTAFGLFNLASGLAMLAASVIAGVLWDRAGPAATFVTGGAFCALAGVGLLLRPRGQAGTTP